MFSLSLSLKMIQAVETHHRKPPMAETVLANDDLLTEILLRLPIRSLLQFKSVCKQWLSLITNPNFKLRRNSILNPSGLFLHRSSRLLHPEFDFVPLDDHENPTKAPFRALTFVNDPSGIRISQSCNGLLLCCSFWPVNAKLNYYIYNPSTNRFTTLPKPSRRGFSFVHGDESVYAVNLAFDPLKSPHFKVVCVYNSDAMSENFEIEIYSSETGFWTPCGDPFHARLNFKFCVFWNGALHWICTWGGNSLYFNLDEERFGALPLPPSSDGWDERRLRYFGESRDHLHLVEIYNSPTTQFNVYEMERDYSGWFVKYCVDIGAVPNAFPEMIRSLRHPSDMHYYGFVILSLVRGGENDEESFLVLHIPGKVIRYNFQDNSFKKLCDIPRGQPDIECPDFEGCLRFGGWFSAFQYIESLADV